MSYYVYIMTSERYGTLYVGVTNNLIRRTWEHKEGVTPGFTNQYGVKKLVFFETYDDVKTAIQREKNTKHWKRDWKIDLIERSNPDWRDMYSDIAT